jgi:hypothetical protein
MISLKLHPEGGELPEIGKSEGNHRGIYQPVNGTVYFSQKMIFKLRLKFSNYFHPISFLKKIFCTWKK